MELLAAGTMAVLAVHRFCISCILYFAAIARCLILGQEAAFRCSVRGLVLPVGCVRLHETGAQMQSAS